MIWEYQSKCIVMLCSFQEEGKVIFSILATPIMCFDSQYETEYNINHDFNTNMKTWYGSTFDGSCLTSHSLFDILKLHV